MIHRIIGILLALFFISVITGNSNFFQGFQDLSRAINGVMGAKVIRGRSYVYLAMFAACYCLIFNSYLVKKWNPWRPFKVSDTYPTSFFIFFGYFWTMVSFFLLSIYE